MTAQMSLLIAVLVKLMLIMVLPILWFIRVATLKRSAVPLLTIRRLITLPPARQHPSLKEMSPIQSILQTPALLPFIRTPPMLLDPSMAMTLVRAPVPLVIPPVTALVPVLTLPLVPNLPQPPKSGLITEAQANRLPTRPTSLPLPREAL